MSFVDQLSYSHTMAGPPSITSKQTLLFLAFFLQTLATFATGSATTKSLDSKGHAGAGHNGNGNGNGNGHTGPTEETTTFLFDRREMIKRDKLVPDVLDETPEQELFVSYYSWWVNMGNLVSCSSSSGIPSVLDWKTEPDTYYTVIMTGPDCPSQKNHTDREYLHWMVTNIRGTQYMNGDVMAEYIGASPSYVTGAHRFLFVVFKQPEPGKMSFDEQPIFDAYPHNKKRTKFSTRNFAKKHGLVAIASNYYWIDLDKPLPTFEPWFRTPDVQ